MAAAGHGTFKRLNIYSLILLLDTDLVVSMRLGIPGHVCIFPMIESMRHMACYSVYFHPLFSPHRQDVSDYVSEAL